MRKRPHTPSPGLPRDAAGFIVLPEVAAAAVARLLELLLPEDADGSGALQTCMKMATSRDGRRRQGHSVKGSKGQNASSIQAVSFHSAARLNHQLACTIDVHTSAPCTQVMALPHQSTSQQCNIQLHASVAAGAATAAGSRACHKQTDANHDQTHLNLAASFSSCWRYSCAARDVYCGNGSARQQHIQQGSWHL